MKAIFVLMLGIALTIGAKAQDTMSDYHSKSKKYCAVMMKGKMTLTVNGQKVNAEVTLKDGTRLSTDCAVSKKDGTKTALKTGECIDSDGLIMLDGEIGDRK